MTPARDERQARLPFENLSHDPDNAYFGDGIQEEILTRLSKIADLKVIPRTSTQRFKSAPDNLLEIAKRLSIFLSRIRLHGVSRIETMLDPFLGIGNSAVAAQRCGVKKLIGFEIDEAYLAAAKRRLGSTESPSSPTAH
jgi:hypothetical protein